MATYLLLVTAFVPLVQAAQKLEIFTVDKAEVSVSGISAGGAMAVQFHTAFSASVRGVGSIAGIPYSCSGGQLGTALGSCMSSPSGINVASLVNHAKSQAGAGKIDATDNLRNTSVYIWAGTSDTVVKTDASRKIEAFYSDFVSPSNIKAVYASGAEHTFPTENYGNPCTSLGSPYLGRCNYNGAYELLNFIHGNLQRPSGDVALKGKFIEYDQTEFLPSSRKKRILLVPDSLLSPLKAYESMSNMMGTMLSSGIAAATSYWDWWKKFWNGIGSGGVSTPGLAGSGSHSMDGTAYAYIPSGCYDSTVVCKLHVAFHGCKMQRETIGDVFARHAGYNEVAELNNIILLYPQIKSDLISNPNGCWDWWAYTGANYDTKGGVQMKAVKNMIDRVTGDNP
ncbi:uncharacterized protein LOC124292207 isoform X1 [Haliotis rubra]|uniref:uncharacterized protein LOC124292207 isoform X1 n=1 Tax=Haliotis rubra TaxID=36100 RepID=UPI001EE62E62|nr:uncharacterized protein LOC124292207 isoform X1 [Haliotis rubra]